LAVHSFAIPETRYALNGDVHLAYQTLGEGPPDIAAVSSGPTSNIEHVWEEPSVARTSWRLASLGRLIQFDNRGVGLSDKVAPRNVPTINEQVDDLRAVLDAANSKRVVLLGYVSGSAPSIAFAATYPERVQAMILCAPYARLLKADDYPIGIETEKVARVVDDTLAGWGKGEIVSRLIPSMAGDAQFRNWWAQMERMGAIPATAATFVRQWFDVDVRPMLPRVHVPTLVFGRKGTPLIPSAHARYVAEHIEGARYVELDGSDLHFSTGDTEPYFEQIEEFLGSPHDLASPDRRLGTILFFDIVRSTELVSRIGDTRWRDLQDSFFKLAAQQLDRFDGRLVETAGDGVLAVFETPGRAIACAKAIREAVRELGFEVRFGVHSGESNNARTGASTGSRSISVPEFPRSLGRVRFSFLGRFATWFKAHRFPSRAGAAIR